MKKTVPLILFLLCFSVFGNEPVVRKRIFVDLSDVKGLDQSSLSYIRKSSFDTVFLTGKFELLLSRPQIKKKGLVYLLDADITPFADQYRIRFKLLENNKLINSVYEQSVEKNKVQLRARILLLKLFFGNNVDERTGKLKKREMIPLSAKSVKEISSEQLNDESSEEENTDEPDEVVNLFNEDEEDVRGSFQVSPDSKKKINKKIIQDFSAPDLVLAKLPVADPSINKRKRKWFVNSQYSLGREVESVETSSIIELKTKSEKIVFDYSTEIQLEDWDNSIELGATIAKPVSESRFRESSIAFGPRISLLSNYRLQIIENHFYASILGEYERVEYGALGIIGEGVQAYTNSSFFVGIKGLLKFELFKRQLSIASSFKKAFLGSTDLNSLGNGFPIEGVKQSAAIEAQLYGSWFLTLKHSKSTYTSLSVKDYGTSHNLNSVHITYK